MARGERRRRGGKPRRGERGIEGGCPGPAAWLWLVIFGAVLLSVPPLIQRAELERGNDAVELVADLDSIRLLSAYVGVPVDAVLADWAARGVTSIGVSTATDLELAARAGLRSVPRTVAAVQALLERGASPARRELSPPDGAVSPGPSGLRSEAAPAAGIFIADGDAVPGYPDDVAATAALLRDVGLTLGVVEFASPEGERQLARLLGDEVVFVHSIPPRELVHLTDEQALARFNRAVLERQARVLYLHALLPAEASTEGARVLLERNGQYVSALVERVRALGLTVGPVRPLPRWESSRLVPVAVAVAAAAAAALAARALVTVSWTWELAFVAAAGALAAALAWTGRDVWARQGAAFAAACAFPALAVLSGVGRPGVEHSFARRFGSVMLATLAGAALVAAALTDTRFFLKLEQFRGVKAAHLLPIIFVALVWLKELLSALAPAASSGRGASAAGLAGRGAPVRLKAWAATAARLVRLVGRRQLAVFVVVAALVLFVLVARTGHDLLPVSSWERSAREALERWLVVRPRTKEFLFGYPALLLGLAFFARRRRRQGWPLAVAGVVAPISVINTFSHAHVALWVSGVRTAYGVIFGSAVASLAYVALALWQKTRSAAEKAAGGRSDERGGAASQEAGLR